MTRCKCHKNQIGKGNQESNLFTFNNLWILTSLLLIGNMLSSADPRESQGCATSM